MILTGLPFNAAGAIARMDFVLGRYVGLHGSYRVEVLVGDIHFSKDGRHVFIRRSVEKNDPTGKNAVVVRLEADDAHPHLCPVRICKAYIALLPDACPTSRLLRNTNINKTKLTRQPMGKNGPLRYVRWAAGFAGIDEDAKANYGSNSWRKAGANKLAQQGKQTLLLYCNFKLFSYFIILYLFIYIYFLFYYYSFIFTSWRPGDGDCTQGHISQVRQRDEGVLEC